MSRGNLTGIALCLCGQMLGIFAGPELRADEATTTVEAIQQLREQNQALQEQLRRQQAQIESLAQKLTEFQAARHTNEVEPTPTEADLPDLPAKQSLFGNLGKVNLSGEGGVAFFRSGSQGQFPHPEFRLDEARLFVEAPVIDTVYFYGELNLATREEPDVELRLGELYVDFENVSRLWNSERLLNVRLGRIYTPFGEEYQSRYAIDNPLISHSLSDLWEVSAGAELYGEAGKFNYALAVQNGGISDPQVFDNDKSVAGRVGYDPRGWLHLSVSGMRTGNIDVQGDKMAGTWFGNGFFRSLGSSATTKFHADLAEADLDLQVAGGSLKAFGGYVHYDDNDPQASNQRDVYYYAVEGVHDLIGRLYLGARFSQIFARHGFPIVANGDFGQNEFGDLTSEIWRLSLGLGYRWSQNLLLKAEYSLEQGQLENGNERRQEDLFGVEAAFKF